MVHIVFMLIFAHGYRELDQHEKQNQMSRCVPREEVNVFHALFYPGDVTGQLTAALPTCPGDTFTFRCTVTGDRSGITIWRVGGSVECYLIHSTAGATSTCGPSNAFTARSETGFGTTATSFTSSLTGTATLTLDDTLVECFGPALSRDAWNMVGDGTLQILGQ